MTKVGESRERVTGGLCADDCPWRNVVGDWDFVRCTLYNDASLGFHAREKWSHRHDGCRNAFKETTDFPPECFDCVYWVRKKRMKGDCVRFPSYVEKASWESCGEFIDKNTHKTLLERLEVKQ